MPVDTRTIAELFEAQAKPLGVSSIASGSDAQSAGGAPVPIKMKKPTDDFQGAGMIEIGSAIDLPSASAVSVLLKQRFSAAWATNKAGEVHRPPPQAIDMPFGEFEIAGRLMNETFVETPDLFVVSVPDGTLVGERAMITRTDQFLITDSLHSRHNPRIFLEKGRRDFEAVHLSDQDGRFIYDRPNRQRHTINGPALVLTAMEHNNYGAFLLRLLPKIISVRGLVEQKMSILAPVNLAWQKRILSALGIDTDRIIAYDREKDFQSELFVFPSMRLSEFFLDDSTREFFQSFATSRTRQAPKGAERIYVSRQSAGIKRPDYRLFTNELELIRKMQEMGFWIFEPEFYSFEDQVAFFAGAKIVVGPGGAGMFNTIFCKPETKVISIESQTDWVGAHSSIFASCKHEHSLIIGGADLSDTSTQKRWRADVACVVNRVKAML